MKLPLIWAVLAALALLFALGGPDEEDAEKRTQLDKQDAIRAASITKESKAIR